jgi:uncharacterized protein
VGIDPEEFSEQAVIASTRDWLERAVIGLNLCPFAKAVHVAGRVHYCVSEARTEDELVGDLARELHMLNEANPEEIETSLLIHPRVLNDFLDFNDFLELADATVEGLGLEGVLQVASFHPGYQFEGTEVDDITNFSNRSPFPTLHLLRESSIERALAQFPDADSIYERNIDTLRKLGHPGWRLLFPS